MTKRVPAPAKENQWARKCRELAADGEPNACYRALESAHCPPDVVAKLLINRDAIVRASAWAHPNLPRERMRKAALSISAGHADDARHWTIPTPDSPWLVINNPALPAKYVKLFPEKHAIAHPNCPTETLLESMVPSKRRSEATAAQNRGRISTNHGISEEVQLAFLLPTLGTTMERLCLSNNPALTANVIKQWIPLEPARRILRSLLKHKSVTPELKVAIFNRIREIVAESGKPITHGDRMAFVKYSDNPNEIADCLGYGRTPNNKVPATMLKYAAYNPHTPRSVILLACHHPDRNTRNAAARHPNCPEEGRIIVGLRS